MKTKELHRTRKFSIGVFDDDNYYVAKIVKSKSDKERLADMRYFSEISNAVKHMAESISKRQAEDLEDWLQTYKKVWKEIKAVLNVK